MNTLRTRLCVTIVAGLSLFGCKARNAESDVKGDEPSTDASTSTGTGGAGKWLVGLEAGLKTTEQVVEVADARDTSSVEGIALADADRIDERQHLLDLADQLQGYAADKVVSNKSSILDMVAELKALSELLSGLTGVDKQRVKVAVARVEGILASPPIVGQANADTPAGVVTPPVRTPAAQPDTEELYCRNLGNNSWLPSIKGTNRDIGYAMQSGQHGFQTLSNCELAVNRARNDLVCSLTQRGMVTAFLVKTGKQLGPDVGFNQTANCVAAVTASDDTICLVDNRTEVGGKFAKYNGQTGAVIDYWFEDHGRCRTGDKSPSADQLCHDRCESTYKSCDYRAKLIPEGNLDRTTAILDCLLAVMECRKKC